MSKTNFFESCPHCGAKIPDLHTRWSNHDNDRDFFFDCEQCEKPIQVTVHQVPEFECAVPTCQWCHKTEVAGNTYCGPCLRKLQASKA